MFEGKRYVPEPAFAERANVKATEYETMYRESIENPEAFWAKQAKRLHWFKPWEKVLEGDFAKGEARWFSGGKLNVAYNCLDRFLKTPTKNKAALIWVGDKPGESKTYTYQQLHKEVCRAANALKSLGVQKGDRILLYLPMIPELAIFSLVAARMGAIHSVVFGGFSAEALQGRIEDAKPKVIVTANAGFRGGRIIDMKNNVDEALYNSSFKVPHVIVVKRVAADTHNYWKAGRDIHWGDLIADPELSFEFPCEEVDSEDPLFILYTSGSTGKPKGILHTTAGYLLGANLSFDTIFDHKPEDTFWCTADLGWITGHSYILYGPLSNGATTMMFEGIGTYPDAGRFWQIIDMHAVNVFYTAPTAIRALMKAPPKFLQRYDLSSLRLLGSVGEPINPEAWQWYFKNVGHAQCPIVDTYWQTETGAVMITPFPGATPTKPGAATLPFFGIRPVLLDAEGKEVEGPGSGYLCIKAPWPSMMRGVYGDEERFFQSYLSQYPGYYFTGDGATRDADGYYWITGRVDDVLNVSGHRLGTAEIEGAILEHKSVAEAAVVPFPHDMKGQGIYAYVTVKEGISTNDLLKQEIIELVMHKIGKIARLDVIHWAPGLPKTRSGKIVRRILRKIAEGEFSSIGDTSTLVDDSVLAVLMEDKAKYH
jgi:acetyl-CoA synthetase